MKFIDGHIKENKLYLQRVTFIILADIIGIALSYSFALLLRFDFSFEKIPPHFVNGLYHFVPFIILVSLVVYNQARLYHSIWVYAGDNEIICVIRAYLFMMLVNLVSVFVPFFTLPRSVFLVGYVFSGMTCLVIRFAYRFVRYAKVTHEKKGAQDHVLLVGAGESAREVIKASRLNVNQDMYIDVLVDDNPNKKGRYLEGIKIEGNRFDIPQLVKKHNIHNIILAMPSASAKDKKDILEICKETNCKVQTLPSMAQIVNEDVAISKIRDVEIEE